MTHGFQNFNAFALMRNPYFKLPLYLQIKYRDRVLWAYNERHLLLLEQYIASSLRGSKPDPQYGWHNQSLFSRLPKWMIVAKHRPSLLKVLLKLSRYDSSPLSSVEYCSNQSSVELCSIINCPKRTTVS